MFICREVFEHICLFSFLLSTVTLVFLRDVFSQGNKWDKYSRMGQVKLFKGCLPQILRCPFLNTLSQMVSTLLINLCLNISIDNSSSRGSSNSSTCNLLSSCTVLIRLAIVTSEAFSLTVMILFSSQFLFNLDYS